MRSSAAGWVSYQAQLEALGLRGIDAFQYVDRIIAGQAFTPGVNDVFFGLACLYFLLIPFLSSRGGSR